MAIVLPFAAARASDSQAQAVQDLTPASVAAFADAEIPAAMRDGKIPGAVFVVVRGNQVICEKAYGVADLKTGEPISTYQTLFRVASISKILTAASVLQLAHTRRLDLRRDVNAYLTRFHIAPAFGEPVTLFNLLTHSSGFDDCQFDYAAHTAADKLSLRDYLAQHQPARVRPPGLFSVYDNYGFTLAGYLVQKISGMPFADYVREQILNPLDMTHSSFSPDAALRGELATGYWLDGETPRAFRPDYVNITPAAGFCTTASDMAGFLVALLADRRPDGGRMFPADVLRGLETRQFAAGPGAPGRDYGFNRISLAGRAALRQTGQWPGFNSVLLLFPKAHCGVFLAYNLYDDLRLGQDVGRRFAGRFIPPDLDTGANAGPPDFPARDSLAPLLGSYLSARAPHGAPELKLPHEIEVTQSPAGNLEIDGGAYRAIGPQSFKEVETDGAAGMSFGRRVFFLAAGGARYLVTQDGTYRRVAWAASTRGRLFLLRTATLVLLSAVVLWPVMALARFIFRSAPQRAASNPPRRVTFSRAARTTALAACALALWFEMSFVLAEWRLKPFAALYGFPAPVKHLLWALPVLMLFAAVLVSFCVLAWRKRAWHPAHRLHYTLLVVALGLFLYAFCSRHLLAAI